MFARIPRPVIGPTTQVRLLPSHLQGPPALAGTPNTFITLSFDFSTGTYHLYRNWTFSVDWSADPPAALFQEQLPIETAVYDSNLCGFSRACIPQPKGGELPDALSFLPMYRAQFRHFEDHDAIILSHTVDANGSDLAGERWAELRRPIGGGWSVYQTGTFAPADGNHRWMGSVAMNAAGYIALGYSVSGTGTFPSIRYASRAPGDPLGLLAGGEVEPIAGGGSQKNSFNRWGDYSTMSVDPEDDCTFWYRQEYYGNNGTFDFKTRIGAFKVPACACTPTQAPEVSCGDGLDNDCNGLIDCDDAACKTSPACVKCALGVTGDPSTKDADCCSNKCQTVKGGSQMFCRGPGDAGASTGLMFAVISGRTRATSGPRSSARRRRRHRHSPGHPAHVPRCIRSHLLKIEALGIARKTGAGGRSRTDMGGKPAGF